MPAYYFNLPLNCGITEPEVAFDNIGSFVFDLSDADMAKAAVVRINNADLLADSLESVLCTIKYLHYKKWLDDECDESVTFEDSASYAKMKRCFGDEIAALEAYRGAK